MEGHILCVILTTAILTNATRINNRLLALTPSKQNAVLDPELKATSLAKAQADADRDLDLDLDRPLAEEEGWQIARASFAREAIHYTVRGGIALLVLSGLVLAGFWLIHKVQHLPPHVVTGAQKMIDPVLKANPFNSPADNNPPAPAPEAVKKVASSSSSASLSHGKTNKRPKRRRQASSRPGHGHVRPVQAGDDPTGGRVVYSDGMITEYSWK
ncbi:MAG: hypothetical protein QG574_5387 [Cyanobacteriota bacterium erpe_2018_sw_21hr_WHONDRS-SW48-000092_B_bin.40]|jgi:hypothetical protein|nr:hypothetical protein [Cyanobacteriota bacterium erpe_2018_sw_21hr_WHONDRS-SW48-000092_B_bin.40]